MSYLNHGRRCAAVFVADRLIGLLPPRWHLCRVPLPPTGEIGVRGRQLPTLPETGL